MNNDTFIILRNDALKALDDHRLGDALNALIGMRAYAADAEASAKLDTVRENYRMMLDYMSKGFADDQRKTLFLSFLRQAATISTQFSRSFELREGTSPYTAAWKTLQKLEVPRTLSALERGRASQRVLFDVVWTSPLWHEEDAATALRLFTGNILTEDDKCLMLSAVMLGSLAFFDPLKLKFLLTAVGCDIPQVKARALVGAVLVTLRWERLAALFSEIGAQWSLAADEKGVVSALADLQAQLLVSLETKKIEHRMQEEIIPEMLKKTRGMKFGKGTFSIESMQEEMDKLSLNPEWAAVQNSFTDKMNEIMEMQQKGADVFIGSFKMYKQNFPFFSCAANWFCPFTFEHPDLPADLRKNSLAKMMLTGNQLCESDKYSFALMLGQMLSAGKLSKHELGGQLSQALGGGIPGAELPEAKPTVQSCIRSYVLDLYRFFKLSRFGDAGSDPFRHDLLLVSREPFGRILCTCANLRELADFTFSFGSYAYALKFYELLEPEAETLQKIGYCHQVAHDYARAAEAYTRANLFQGDSVWTLRQLAYCHRSMGAYAEALASYEELEHLLPEDGGVALRAGECLVMLEQPEDALRKLYKAYYLMPDSKGTLRALAWCSLLTERDDEAAGYYDKLLDLDPSPADLLNAGHAAWVAGRVTQAVERYTAYARTLGEQADADSIFTDDLTFLSSRGITADDLRIMADVVKEAIFSAASER